MAKFVVKTRKDGEFQFDLKASNGQVILTSEGYSAKASCMNGIESVRKNSQEDSRYERIEASTGRWRFNLKASNGQVIGVSEAYESKAGMENGIESVKKNGQTQDVEDSTVS
ncbi:hypothetical protein SAMN04487996_107139 [Dyadobacter soli]|uniref:DUF1508 domain-containing protein n=1 Tax=Dyadobacter soli TaxID=659014 RepID=A0A1G7G650_9BACT|nr:YegP family protein [Dyadobacter soli]SDE83616.1 hypothetical protein SAMN04487996_107139 [Dyadobacter soli]